MSDFIANGPALLSPFYLQKSIAFHTAPVAFCKVVTSLTSNAAQSFRANAAELSARTASRIFKRGIRVEFDLAVAFLSGNAFSIRVKEEIVACAFSAGCLGGTSQAFSVISAFLAYGLANRKEVVSAGEITLVAFIVRIVVVEHTSYSFFLQPEIGFAL